MSRKYRAIRISEKGDLTDEKNNPIICPVRNGVCNFRCAWYSVEGKIIRCQETIIGAVRGKPVRSFRLVLGPVVYDLDELYSAGEDNP